MAIVWHTNMTAREHTAACDDGRLLPSLATFMWLSRASLVRRSSISAQVPRDPRVAQAPVCQGGMMAGGSRLLSVRRPILSVRAFW
jgi:hypothetical protein